MLIYLIFFIYYEVIKSYGKTLSLLTTIKANQLLNITPGTPKLHDLDYPVQKKSAPEWFNWSLFRMFETTFRDDETVQYGTTVSYISPQKVPPHIRTASSHVNEVVAQETIMSGPGTGREESKHEFKVVKNEFELLDKVQVKVETQSSKVPFIRWSLQFPNRTLPGRQKVFNTLLPICTNTTSTTLATTYLQGA